jgi:hypothetical protein
LSAGRPLRWERCVLNRGEDAAGFFREHLAEPGRRVLLISGAGFDPRTLHTPHLVAEAVNGNLLQSILIRETRPNPDAGLLATAEANTEVLTRLIPSSRIEHVEIFASDLAVVGGREAARIAARIEFSQYSDIIVDASALSRGIVFPIVRVLLDSVPRGCNLHVTVVQEPSTDQVIHVVGCERVTTIHGFKGRLGLESSSSAAVLWLPQLVIGQVGILRQIYNFIQPSPNDVCPILPFPSGNPRDVDALLLEYRIELGAWEVDPRDLMYAHEDDPLDLYRTIVGLADARERVFRDIGGSEIVLSPVGSKLLSLGAMMAAIDRDFPVLYVEAVDFSIESGGLDSREPGELVHIWLHGEAYA